MVQLNLLLVKHKTSEINTSAMTADRSAYFADRVRVRVIDMSLLSA